MAPRLQEVLPIHGQTGGIHIHEGKKTCPPHSRQVEARAVPWRAFQFCVQCAVQRVLPGIIKHGLNRITDPLVKFHNRLFTF